MKKYNNSIIDFLIVIILIIVVIFFLVGVVFAAYDAIGDKKVKKLIAITFDDGPKPNVLKNLLPLLEEQNVKATFFVNGFRFKEDANSQALIKKMARDGHSIQNHTYSHGNLKKMEEKYGRRWILDDIEKNADLIEKYAGKKPIFLRPPFWVIWPDLKKSIESGGYVVLSLENGDINSNDYTLALKNETRDKIVALVLGMIKQRERRGEFSHVLVFHEISGTVKILPELIKRLKEMGYEFDVIENVYPHTLKEAR